MTQYLIAALIVSSSFAAFQSWRHSNTLKELSVVETKLEEKSAEIVALNNAILDERGNSLDHRFLQKAAQLDALESKRELDGYVNRTPTVIAKPGLVSRKINRAFIKQQERLACITGDNTACIDTQ